MTDLLLNRILNKIKKSIKTTKLDLTGYTILTEVGSGLYTFTPIIALLAKAEKVYAWTNDSAYGKAEENIKTCISIIERSNIDKKIEFNIGDKNIKHLQEADIITNSGFLRPLSEEKLKYVNENAVLPLMYEKWELRDSDVDVEYCQKKNIPVAGTWENHPTIKVFDHVGPLAIKMAFEAGYEVFNNNILVWSDDNFGEVITDSFKDIGANKVIMTTDQNTLYDEAKSLDFIFITDYDEDREFGKDGFFDFEKLSQLNNTLGIVHLYGKIDAKKASRYLSVVYPNVNGRSNTMSFTLAHVGLNPFIDLQVAGFKVGELLKSGKKSDLVQII